MSQIKTIISSLSFAATLTAVLTSPALARADECNDIEQRKQRVAKELAKLTTDHPAVMLSVAACVEAARSRPEDEQAATMGLCVVGVCLFAGEATCDDVASRGLRFILEEVALEAMAPASCSERSMAPAPTTPATTSSKRGSSVIRTASPTLAS